jgi:hypothetical protein
LNDSGYRTIRKKMLCSCTLRQFYELIESKLPSTIGPKEGTITVKTDAEFLDEFVSILHDELKDVMTFALIFLHSLMSGLKSW